MSVRPFVLLALSVALSLLPPSFAEGRGRGDDGPNRAGLVVRYGDGRVVTACVSFSEPAISGEELLYRAGLEVSVQSFGGLGNAVCAINGEGCQPPGEPCFCRCQTMGEACTYWVYAHLGEDGQWRSAGRGPSTTMLHNGDVDGWAWGSEAALPALTFADICAAPATATGAPPTFTPTPPPVTVTTTLLPPTLTLLPATAMLPSPTPLPATVTPTPQAPGGAMPSWGAYASFIALGVLLAGALVWLVRRQGGSS